MPQLGEVKRGRDLGYANRKAAFVWVACCECSMERWVMMHHGLPSSKRCSHCVMTPEVKEKVRQARLGTKASLETRAKMSAQRKGKSTWLKGLTKETHPGVARIAASKKGRPPQTPPWNTGLTKATHPGLAKMAKRKQVTSLGRGNANWRGGLSFHDYSIYFNKHLKAKIRERDNYTCQFPYCGIRENGTSHDVHHIDYDKQNNREDNLMTLCHYHNGRVNGDRAYWAQYFRSLLLDTPTRYRQLEIGVLIV